MRKKIILLLSFLALVSSARAQDEEAFDFDDESNAASADSNESTLDADIGDSDFSDEDVSDADFGDDATATAKKDAATDAAENATVEEADPENAVEPIAPTEKAEAPPVVTEESPAVAEEPVAPAPKPNIPDTDIPPSIMNDGVAFGDSPDLEYEASLYDIYLNYNSKPLSEGEWNKILAERTVENYRIQKGDNLWDISRTIFGDGNYWPKIWSINSKIHNPHLIEPQNSIKFLLGDESGPPAFTVTEADVAAGGAPADPGAVVDETSDEVDPAQGSPEPEIPPPAVRSRPVVKRLPPSLPQWQDPQSVNSNFDSVGFEYKRRKIADIVDSIPLSSYVSEAPPENLGQVVEVETGNKLASSLQYVYVTVNEDADIGDTFLSVRNRGKVEKTTPLVKDSFLGYGIEVLGEIQLVEKVNGENERKNGALYRALVTRIVNPVEVGAILTKGKIESVNLAENGAKSQVVAQIVGGQLFNQRQVYGPESIAFLNKGENAGIEAGQMLPIRAYRKLRNDNSIVTGNVRAIGWLKVIKTTPRFSTAIVLRAWSDILSGDLTGAGEMSSLSLSPNASLDEPGQKTSLLKELDDDTAAPEKSKSEDDTFDDGGPEDIGGDADFSEDDVSDEDFE